MMNKKTLIAVGTTLALSLSSASVLAVPNMQMQAKSMQSTTNDVKPPDGKCASKADKKAFQGKCGSDFKASGGKCGASPNKMDKQKMKNGKSATGKCGSVSCGSKK